MKDYNKLSDLNDLSFQNVSLLSSLCARQFQIEPFKRRCPVDRVLLNLLNLVQFVAKFTEFAESSVDFQI